MAYILATASTFAPILLERMRTAAVAGNFVEVKVEDILVQVSVDNEYLATGSGHENTEVAVKVVLFPGRVGCVDLIFRKLKPEHADDAP